jgi:hypothetical protein
VINNNYKSQLDISALKYKAKYDQLIPDYFNRHLNINVDGSVRKLNYVGYEKEKESLYCYFQADNIITPKKVDILNSILHDFNESQINIIHVMVNGKRQSTKLNCPEKEASFSF